MMSCHQFKRGCRRLLGAAASTWPLARVCACAIKKLSLSLDTGIDKATLEDRHDENNQEENDRHRRGGAKATIVKGRVIDLQHRCQGGIEWAAIGHKLGLIKHLESADGTQSNHQENGRAQERHRDEPEGLKTIGSIDLGGFEDFAWQILESRQKIDHESSTSAPDKQQHQCRQCPERIVNQSGPEIWINENRI